MGFSLSAFAGGFAGALAEDIEKEEKLAEARAVNGVKNMQETYKTMAAENRKLKTGLVENINALRAYDPSATEAELFEIAKSKPLMDLITSKVKSGEYDASTMKLSTFATIPENNTTSTALQLVDELFAVPKVVEAQKQMQTAKTGNFFRDLIASAGDKAGERMARQTAEGLGVSLEQLQAAERYKTPTISSSATAKMEAFEKPKSFDKMVDDAKIRMVTAAKTGDKQAYQLAQADALIYSDIVSKMSPAQTQFANKVADIKNRYMFGSAEERAAAKPEYDKLMADLRSEAAAKKAGEGKDDKIPSLGTLNTFTSAAVARKVAEIHGDLVRSKQLAIIEKPDGSSSLEYTGDNQAIRKQINQTAFNAAKNALSLYTLPDGKGMSRDVDAVLNTYKPTDMSLPVDQPEKPAAAPTSTPAPKTKAEYDAIPKGTRYIDTDGKTKIKG